MFLKPKFTEGQVMNVATLVKDVWKNETLLLMKKLLWYCTKHNECGDMLHFCSRETNTPCKHRVKNINAEKSIEAISKI